MAAASATATTTDRDSPPPLPRLIPELPDDISLLCVARVPRLFHPTLAVTSRSFRYLVTCPSFYAARSSLHLSHHFPVISIRTRSSSSSQWYLLDCHPLNPRPLLPLPYLPLPTVGSACVSLGPFLFLLGGSIDNLPTSKVQILDSRLRRWEVGPRMGVCREFAAAGMVKGRIYVFGGCSPSAEAWAEVWDFGGGDEDWEVVKSPARFREKWMHGHVVLGGKILGVADRGGVVFDPVERSWGMVSTVLDLGWRGRATVVGGIVFSYDYLGKIKGYDRVEDKWKEVEGIEKELPKFLSGATLAEVDGRLCVVWEGKRRKHCSKQMVLMFAVIDVKVASDGRLRGSVVWADSMVLPLPPGSTIAHCLAVEL